MVDDADQAHGAIELDPQYGGSRFSFHVSSWLLVSLLAALASTVMVVVVWAARAGAPPPPGGGGGPGGGPRPGEVTDTLLITVAVSIIAWVAVLVALARDQVNRRLSRLPDRTALESAARAATNAMLPSLRELLRQDRKVEQAAAEERITAIIRDYGDQRETEGYVRGMHEGRHDPGRDDPGGGAQVRPLRR